MLLISDITVISILEHVNDSSDLRFSSKAKPMKRQARA